MMHRLINNDYAHACTVTLDDGRQIIALANPEPLSKFVDPDRKMIEIIIDRHDMPVDIIDRMEDARMRRSDFFQAAVPIEKVDFMNPPSTAWRAFYRRTSMPRRW